MAYKPRQSGKLEFFKGEQGTEKSMGLRGYFKSGIL